MGFDPSSAAQDKFKRFNCTVTSKQGKYTSASKRTSLLIEKALKLMLNSTQTFGISFEKKIESSVKLENVAVLVSKHPSYVNTFFLLLRVFLS